MRVGMSIANEQAQMLIRAIRKVVRAVALILVTFVVIWAFSARSLPDLQVWHEVRIESEFNADRNSDVGTLSEYLELEQVVFDELKEQVFADSATVTTIGVSRYKSDSIFSSQNHERDWNRTTELKPARPRGAALMLHGLTDSPYSMRSTAELFYKAGYHVLVPRLPGHGTAPAGLGRAHWEDWQAVVKIGARHLRSSVGADLPFVIVGYSNGGLMAVDYALRCEEFAALPCPDGIVLLSPAIAVTPLAVAANLHSAISWMPYFEKAKWQTILPEIDPFKFTSFPMRAGWEIYKVSRRLHKQLGQAAKVAKLPPILTFQSVVDNTVTASAIVTNLYDKLPANGSDLVVYDVNRSSTVLHLMKNLPENPVGYFESVAPLNFGVTVLGNRSRQGREVDTAVLAAGTRNAVVKETEYQWPLGIYSMSHIAVPFRTDDPVYGDGSVRDKDDRGLVFGALAPRGEQGVLRLAPAYFLRTRYNPFFEFQEAYMIEWLGGLAEADDK